MGLIIDLLVQNTIEVWNNTQGLHLTAIAWGLVGGFFYWGGVFDILNEYLNRTVSFLLSLPISFGLGFLTVAALFAGLILSIALLSLLAVPLVILLTAYVTIFG
jgi:hypothetical protein